METLAETEYQDLYRVTDGVLLVINKFEFIKYEENKWISCCRPKVKLYNNGCQKQLQILKEDYYSSYDQKIIPKGTVLYYGVQVRLVNKNKWNYQIKTTGECFSGDIKKITELLNKILEKVREEN